MNRAWEPSEARETPFEAIIVSRVCLLRESLSLAMASDPAIRVLEACADPGRALELVETLRPGMVVLDATFRGGRALAAQLGRMFPRTQVVAVALAETEDTVLDWAEAGIAGYVPDTASMRELPSLLMQIRRGEQRCPSAISGSLLRRMGRGGGETGGRGEGAGAALTPRERIVVRHIAGGLSNKDIARRLDISLGTAKSHVHNILGKLHLRSRAQLMASLRSGLVEYLDSAA